MSPWQKLLEQPHSRGHFVQLYSSDETALTNNIGHYLWEGLRVGEAALVIVTAEHQALFSQHLARLGADLPLLLDSRQLVFRDAQETLNQFMIGGQPDWRRFESLMCALMREVRPFTGTEGLRAYGEMVGILWKAKQFAAAIRLEQLWNKLLEQSSFSLYCAYSVDIFGKDFEIANLEAVLCTHTHVIPSQPNGLLETALNRSMDELLGLDAEPLRVLIKASHRPAWAIMPTAEAIVLWLRKNLPDQANKIIARAQHHHQLLSRRAVSPAVGD